MVEHENGFLQRSRKKYIGKIYIISIAVNGNRLQLEYICNDN